jgi:hypothetical protein
MNSEGMEFRVGFRNRWGQMPYRMSTLLLAGKMVRPAAFVDGVGDE